MRVVLDEDVHQLAHRIDDVGAKRIASVGDGSREGAGRRRYRREVRGDLSELVLEVLLKVHSPASSAILWR